MKRNKIVRQRGTYPIFPSLLKDHRKSSNSSTSDETSSDDNLTGGRRSRSLTRRTPNRRNNKYDYSSSDEEESTRQCRDCCYEKETDDRCDNMKRFYVSGKCDNNINQILKRIKKRYSNTNVKIYLDPCVTHCLNSSFDLDVNLHIVGDEHHAVGVSYLHQTALDNASTVFRSMPAQIGVGPYKIDISGNDITVYSETGFCDPEFSGVEGRILKLYQPNSCGGKFTCYKIKRACGNTITLNTCPQLEGCVVTGVGFVIEPNVRLDVGEQNKLLSNSMNVKGINVVSGNDACDQFFLFGSTLGTTRFGNILLNSPVILTGQIDGHRPSTNLSTFWLQAPYGQLFRYSNLGAKATTVSAHSANLVTYSSQWIGSNVGLQQIQGSIQQNYLGFFHQNITGVSASGNSVHGASGNVYTYNQTGIDLDLTGSITQVDNPLTKAFNHLNFGRNNTTIQLSRHSQLNINQGTDTYSSTTLYLDGAADINFGKVTINKRDPIEYPDDHAAVYRNPNNPISPTNPYVVPILDSTSVYTTIPDQNGDLDPSRSTDTTFAYDELVITTPP